tara:strand:+ start:576 stop:932 length:357 start_codon:yes stop_codon:yes gene_type:complete
MKTTLLFLSVFLSVNIFGQNYDVGILSYGTTIVKATGQVMISDSTVTLEMNDTYVYDIVKKANNTIYITDGVITGSIVKAKREGKLKKFNYDMILQYNQNINNPSTVVVSYWCKERSE